MPPAGSTETRAANGYHDEAAYPSRTIAYQAAGMITSIVEALQAHDQLRYTPAFMYVTMKRALLALLTICSVYSLFSALIMHVYQMRSSNQSIVSATQQRLTTCMNALRDVSKVWLVAKMVHTLFESILGNKNMEERLQKAAGRRHNKIKIHNQMNGSKIKEQPGMESINEAHKRKFEDMELGYTNGPPAPQMSYERSRPQSPVATPGRENGQQNPNTTQQSLPTISATSPPQRQATDAFMGRNTRPTTPFNTYSYPGTPPELFLHTRQSPKISDDLWQNYGPEQLFPPETNGLFPMQSPTQNMVDPALRSQPPTSFPPQQMSQAGPITTMAEGGSSQQAHMGMNFSQNNADWAHLHNMQGQQQQARSEDQWSNTSSMGPSVPTTLNVGDWFEFFGIPNNGPGEYASVGSLGAGY